MAQAAPARITCRVCDGWYDSERELRDHMRAAHRRFIAEPITSQHLVTPPQNINSELRKQNEERTNEESSPSLLPPGRFGRV
jgi:hypothetical protein